MWIRAAAVLSNSALISHHIQRLLSGWSVNQRSTGRWNKDAHPSQGLAGYSWLYENSCMLMEGLYRRFGPHVTIGPVWWRSLRYLCRLICKAAIQQPALTLWRSLIGKWECQRQLDRLICGGYSNNPYQHNSPLVNRICRAVIQITRPQN